MTPLMVDCPPGCPLAGQIHAHAELPVKNYVGIRGTDIFGPVYDGAPCIVCGTRVDPGDGAQAMPPLPAIHTRCLRTAVAAAGLDPDGPPPED